MRRVLALFVGVGVAMICGCDRRGNEESTDLTRALPAGFVTDVFGFTPPREFNLERLEIIWGKDSMIYGVGTCDSRANIVGHLNEALGLTKLDKMDRVLIDDRESGLPEWYYLSRGETLAAFEGDREGRVLIVVSTADESEGQRIFLRRSSRRSFPKYVWDFFGNNKKWESAPSAPSTQP